MDDHPMFYAARCPPSLDCIQVSILPPAPSTLLGFSGFEYRNTYFSLTHFCSECPLGAQFCSPHMLYYLKCFKFLSLSHLVCVRVICCLIKEGCLIDPPIKKKEKKIIVCISHSKPEDKSPGGERNPTLKVR